jgi:hypothetical protein
MKVTLALFEADQPDLLFSGILTSWRCVKIVVFEWFEASDPNVAQPFRAARRPLAGLKACATKGRRQF